MKTFNQFISEAYSILDEDAASYARRQANKQARGREGKTSKYVEKTTGRVERSPEGKLEVKKSSEKKVGAKTQIGMFKAGKIGAGPSGRERVGSKFKPKERKFSSSDREQTKSWGSSGGGGGEKMGYRPAPHSTGGVNRGKKKGEQTKAPEPTLNKYQRKAAVAKAKHYRTGGSTMQSGLVGDRAAERIRAKARKSFGAWSKEKG